MSLAISGSKVSSLIRFRSSDLGVWASDRRFLTLDLAADDIVSSGIDLRDASWIDDAWLEGGGSSSYVKLLFSFPAPDE